MGWFRFLLAILVVFCHFGAIDGSFGSIVVCCFFVISGFYTQLILSNPKVKTSNFYLSRFFRIYPLYWAFLFIALLMAPHEFCQVGNVPWLITVCITSNISLIGRDILSLFQFGYNTGHFSLLFSLADLQHGNWLGGALGALGQTWSLSIEVMFYLLAPAILQLKSSKIILLTIICFFIKLYIFSFGEYNNFWVKAFFPAELYLFLTGSLAFRAYMLFFAKGDITSQKTSRYLSIAFFGLMILFIGWDKDGIILNKNWFIIYFTFTGCTALILPFLFYISKNNKLDRGLGNLSYAIYLAHPIARDITMDILHSTNPAIAIALTLGISVAAYYIFEIPIDRFRHKMFPTYTNQK